MCKQKNLTLSFAEVFIVHILMFELCILRLFFGELHDIQLHLICYMTTEV